VTLALTAPADAGAHPTVQLAASVESADVEAWPGDESATQSTTIGPMPVVSIADAQILEGDSGITDMVFAVTLSEPPVLPVEITFATADGTAALNEDYNTVEGFVSFAVGQTTGTATVLVRGDPMYELDETFSVVLQTGELINAVLGDATATGTILNDDPLVQRTLVVDDAGDAVANDGVCTLREAIQRANARAWFVDDCGWGQPYLPGEPLTRDRIVFAIPGAGPIANELNKALSAITGVGPTFTIHLNSALPAITDAVEIDATTQPGAACTTWPPTLKVVLDGSALSGTEDGLAISAADTLVRGLAIHSFPGDGVDITGDGARLSCNFIGTGADGTVDLGNAGAGVRISGSPVGVLVGTDGDGVGDVAERNLISGNDGGGIHVTGTGGVIAGNLIGPDREGACGIGNATAGIIADSVELLVGADVDDPGGVEGNFIACNASHGLVVTGAATDGLTARGNEIQDNADAGIFVSGVPGDVYLDDNHVGGNGGAGVLVASDAHGVHLRRNRLVGNDGLGIDLVAAGAVADGVTANDTGDADTGANGLQNFPVLESALYTGGTVAVTGHLESAANADYVIEFFAIDEADASGHGQGDRFLGELAVTTDANGQVSFATSLSGNAEDDWLSATATDASGNTSEFSAARSIHIASVTTLASTPNPSDVGQSVTFTASVTADGATPTGSVIFRDGASILGTSPLDGGGVASLAIDTLAAGSRSISAEYSGSPSHGGSASAPLIQVVKHASTTAITAIAPAASQTIGVPYAVSVSIAGAAPTGAVTVDDGDGNNCTITLPATHCALTSTSIGAKTITATYDGDANNSASSDTESYSITASAGNPGGLQVGAVTLPPTVAAPGVNAPVIVNFAQAFNAIPVVIVQPSDEDADPQAVRIRNVTTTGFELLQVEPPGCIGCTGAGGTMTVHWLAAMPGSYRLTQDTNVVPAWALTTRGSGVGALLKVGAITTTATQYNSLLGGFGMWPLPAWEAIHWPVLGNGLDFGSAPVVLTSIQSWNNEGANLTGAGLVGPSQPWATSVARNVGASGFELAIEASEVSADDLPPPGFAVGESIGYVAIEGDVSQLLLPIGGPPYVGLVTGTATAGSGCTSSDHQFPAATPIDAANFKAFAGKQSRNAPAGGWLRRCLLGSPGGTTVTVGMRLEEDQFAEAPSGNPADSAGLTAFSGSFLTTPVTLAKMSVERQDGGLRVRWSTTHEVGQVGFRLWGRSGPAGDWQLLTPNLIASVGEESRAARVYEHVVATAGSISEVRIEDVDVVGASRFHPAVAVGASRGEEPVDASVDWTAIRASNAQTPVARASTALVATALAQVNADGVQRIAVADLIAVDGRFNGQPAASLAVLDGNLPIPRHVDCALLQAGCTIEFLGVARVSRYGAENAYAVTLDAGAARPVDSGHAQAGSGVLHVITDQVVHYPNREFNSSAPADDPWLDERLIASSGPAQLTRSFALPERAPGPVQLTVDVWGGLDFPDLPPDHHVQILVNGQVLADRWFDSFVAERIEVAVPEALLAASNTLTLRMPRDTGYSVDIVMLDGFKVSYPRRTRVSGGSLVLGSIDPTAVGTGVGEFRDGFETAAAPPPARFQIDGQAQGAVLWSLVGGELRRDELTAAPVLLPVASTAWRVADPAAVRTPALSLPADAYALPPQLDYLVIAHPLFESGLAPLLALQSSRGLSTAVLRTDAVYAAHSDHVRDPQAIKAAIAAAAQRGARYVLLVGGDSIDYHDYLGSGSQSYLPTWYTQSSRYIFHAATDHPYADLSGDEQPELAIGRLPVRTTTELTRAITSITARGNSVAQRFLAVAGASQPGESFALHSRAIVGYLRQPGQQREYALADEIGTAAARTQARAGLAGSADWVTYLGHSSAHRWAIDNLLDVSQLASISRTGALAVVSQWGCWNNNFTAPTQDTMAHALMLRSNRLAAAVLGATSLAEDASHLALGTRFFDIVEDGRLGDHGGLPITTMGEALQAAKADLLQREPAHRSAAYTIVLFGDPAAPLQ